ncbi:prolyl oligopeptidase family serine peptidase [Neobacillus sp. D3-1R]|uniref:prolyl oligopeptidase family serine peptidase n=1 Tax=Neobacillus sp. D3-1R TaxID=3445778 RepID=UPI003F9FD09A
MIMVEKLDVKDIPCLHIVDHQKASKSLPLVIFIHGFSSAKEHNLHYAYLLAEKGMRVVLPEALFHGERHKSINTKEIAYHFWDIVLNTIEELPLIKEYFHKRNLIQGNKIGVAGTSMGGIVTLGSVTKYDWIESAVCLMGLPSFNQFAQLQLEEMEKHGINLPITEDEKQALLEKLKQYDLSLHPELLRNRPLLFWHGKLDPIVPFRFSYDFFESIKDENKQVQFIVDEKADHKVSRIGLLKTVEWFETHLK